MLSVRANRLGEEQKAGQEVGLGEFGALSVCTPLNLEKPFRERRDPVGCDLSALVHLQKELPCHR